mgnify:CR=1 FL=1
MSETKISIIKRYIIVVSVTLGVAGWELTLFQLYCMPMSPMPLPLKRMVFNETLPIFAYNSLSVFSIPGILIMTCLRECGIYSSDFFKLVSFLCIVPQYFSFLYLGRFLCKLIDYWDKFINKKLAQDITPKEE